MNKLVITLSTDGMNQTLDLQTQFNALVDAIRKGYQKRAKEQFDPIVAKFVIALDNCNATIEGMDLKRTNK